MNTSTRRQRLALQYLGRRPMTPIQLANAMFGTHYARSKTTRLEVLETLHQLRDQGKVVNENNRWSIVEEA